MLNYSNDQLKGVISLWSGLDYAGRAMFWFTNKKQFIRVIWMWIKLHCSCYMSLQVQLNREKCLAIIFSYTPFVILSYLIQTLLNRGIKQKIDLLKIKLRLIRKSIILYSPSVLIGLYTTDLLFSSMWLNIIWQRCNPAVLCVCVWFPVHVCSYMLVFAALWERFWDVILLPNDYLPAVCHSFSLSPLLLSHRAINTLSCSLTSVEGCTGWERWRGLARSWLVRTHLFLLCHTKSGSS